MVTQTKDLWNLVWGKPQIDPGDLAAAVQDQALGDVELDYRTRLLIRDSIDALKIHWGAKRVDEWLGHSPAKSRIETICHEPFDKIGFPSIKDRLVKKTDPEDVRRMFRELSTHIREPLRLLVAGAIAMIMPDFISRSTEDVDLIDEVPKELRDLHGVLEDLHKRYGLYFGHVQSHYFPSGFMNRVYFFESYGELDVYFVDIYDIFLGKLTSIRTKDLDDLRMLAPGLDKATLVKRLQTTMESTFAAKSLKERSEKNWYIVFGEKLPS